VVETEPSLKAATASASYKPAKLETGVTVQVPPFIQVGDKVRVDPSEGTYLERIK
jgi:elongation factor P